MDFIDIIIAIAVIAGSFLLSGKKKSREETARPVVKPSTTSDSYDSESAWESYGEEESAETPDYNYRREAEFQKEYFSYETPQVEEPSRVSVPDPASEETVENLVRVPVMDGFDLRKAFIYQTILERVEY